MARRKPSRIGVASKLPHQSKTVQISTAQTAVMFLLHHYFPNVDANIFIAWGLIAAVGLRFITKDKLAWYGLK